MAQIPLGVGAYSRPYGKLPEIRCENRFFEDNPTGAEKTALLSRPGTKLFLEVGLGPIRTLYTQPGVFEGDLFIVSGTKLFRYSGGTTIEIDGDVLGDGFPIIASIALHGQPDTLFITDGFTLQYYRSAEVGVHTLQPCAVPDDVAISDLAVLASHVICVEGKSRRFFWIRPGETDIDPLDFSSAESEPDEIVSVITVGDQFWLFGQSSTEAWYASGDGDQPFLRAQGRAFSQGILEGTVARVQEAIVVVGQDRVAYRIRGGPERISHHGIEEMLRQWDELAEIRVTFDFSQQTQRSVQFIGYAATPAPIAGWAWDFGDGNVSDEQSPLHEYAALGTYTVTLTATDDEGRSGSVSRIVNVVSKLPAPEAFAGEWSRTSADDEQIELTWDDPTPYVAALPRKVYHDGVEIADLAAGVVSFVHDSDHGSVPLAGEEDNPYTARYYEGADLGALADVSVWSGPPGVPIIIVFVTSASTTEAYDIETSGVEFPGTGLWTQVWDKLAGDPDFDFANEVEGNLATSVQHTGAGDVAVQGRVRFRRIHFSISDYGKFSEAADAVLSEL